MKERVQRWAQTIDGMALRERALILLAAVATLFLLFDALFYQPILKSHQRANSQIVDMQMRLTVLQQTSTELIETDVSASAVKKRDDLRAELDALDDTVRAQLGTLMNPADATRILREMVNLQQGLKLVSLNTEVSGPVTEAMTGQPTDTGALGVGRYDLTVQLEGSYRSITRYLESLETLPWKLFWEHLELAVDAHPRSRVTLHAYTLRAYDG